MIINIPTRVLKAVGEVCRNSLVSECVIEFTKGRYRIAASDKVRLFIYEGKHDLTDFPKYVSFIGGAIYLTAKDLHKDENVPVEIEDKKIIIRVLKIKGGETSIETHEIIQTEFPIFVHKYRNVFPAIPSERAPMLSDKVWKTIWKIEKLFKDEPIRYISFGEHSPFCIAIGSNCYLMVMPLNTGLTCNPEEWKKELAAIKEEF